MSQFIDDGELERFAKDVVDGARRAETTAARILQSIAWRREYEQRAQCSCATNACVCLLPIPRDETKIQPGDAITQTLPDGRVLTLGALGVRRHSDGTFDVCTAGWPAAIVSTRYPEHGKIELAYKGNGFTKAELRHRREKFGGDWEDGL